MWDKNACLYKDKTMDYAAKDVHVCCEAKGLLGQTVQTKKSRKAAVTHYNNSKWTNRTKQKQPSDTGSRLSALSYVVA